MATNTLTACHNYCGSTRMARSIERSIFAVQGYESVCAGITGLLLRTDGSLLVGDDTGIYAFLGDSALQTFGVDGGRAG